MGDPGPPPPSMLIVAAFSRHDDALDWARRRAASAWGEPVLESERFAFRETDYYRRSMGTDLKKEFWGFAPGLDPHGCRRSSSKRTPGRPSTHTAAAERRIGP